MATNPMEMMEQNEVDDFDVDPAHSVVEFAVKHMMFSTVKGRFRKVNGVIRLNGTDLTRSSVEAKAEVVSIDTGDGDRDTHLRSADFFDVEHFPTLSFRSRRIERKGKGDDYAIHGDLTIRGTTREVTFDATYLGQGIDPWGKSRVGITAATTINRKDYGLQWNVALEAGGFLVGDNVKITLDVQAVRQ